MRHRITLILAAVLLLALATPSLAAPPTSMNVQGRLTDAGGSPLPPGPKTLTFQIFDAEVGGVEVWTGGAGQIQVVISDVDGLWNANVGAILPLPDYVFLDSVRWLEITVDDGISGPVVLPRTRLVTGPYAYRVMTVDGASGGTITSKVSIGPGHTNTGDNAFVAGENNIVSGDHAVVAGGGGTIPLFANDASGVWSVIGGGTRNFARGQTSTIGGGVFNSTEEEASTVGGGYGNQSHGRYATVGGGINNQAMGNTATTGGGRDNWATDSAATIGGGHRNRASAHNSTVSGGAKNTAGEKWATVSGGQNSSASGIQATVGGGSANTASATSSTIAGGGFSWASGDRSGSGGGQFNRAHGAFSTVAGGGGSNEGDSNSALGDYAAIGGGTGNVASGFGATVPGGDHNTAAGDHSMAVGRRAKANHGGAFVWGDSTDTDFSSTAPNQFLIRAGGGVGIGTNAPMFPLHLQSTDSVGGYFTANYADNPTSAVRGEYTGGSADARGVLGLSIPSDFWGIGGEFIGGFIGVRAKVLPTGANSYYGVNGQAVGGTGTNWGVYGLASGGGTNYGIYGVAAGAGTNWAGYFDGNVDVVGTLSKGAGSFKIDHPLDPENKYLYHSFVESPDMMNIYNGNVTTDASGDAVVTMPDYFNALNSDFRYQLTVIGQFAQAIVAEKITGNTFTIRTDKPNVEVSWQVTGVRQDAFAKANRIPVEEAKPVAERGLYKYPAVHGQPLTKGVDFKQTQERLKKPSASIVR